MSKQDFIKWLKSFFVDVEFTDTTEERIKFMLEMVEADKPMRTVVKYRDRVVVKKLDRVVYVDRLTGSKIGARCTKSESLQRQPLDIIAKEVCSRHGIELEQLRGRTRTRPLVDARKEFIEYAWTIYPYTSAELARFLNRDHSSILHLKNKYKY